jgi:hypothetical protein
VAADLLPAFGEVPPESLRGWAHVRLHPQGRALSGPNRLLSGAMRFESLMVSFLRSASREDRAADGDLPLGAASRDPGSVE